MSGNFFDLTIFMKNFYDLVKILGNAGQNMTTPPPPPPPPNVNGFATSLLIGRDYAPNIQTLNVLQAPSDPDKPFYYFHQTWLLSLWWYC